MEILDLAQGQWHLRAVGEEAWTPVSVPGEVHTALLNAGRIPDPFKSDNELLVKWVAETDWEFEGLIDVSESFCAQEKIWLVFDGLDTLAQVSLNGIILGTTDNAFRTYAWVVGDKLTPGENRVRIVFKSPVEYVKALQDQSPLISPEQSINWAALCLKQQKFGRCVFLGGLA
jgi:beta-mannosidase